MVSIMPYPTTGGGLISIVMPQFAQPLIRSNPNVPMGDMKRIFDNSIVGSLTTNENNLHKNITARQGLNGATVVFVMDDPTNFSFIITEPDARYVNSITFQKGTVTNGTIFEIEVVSQFHIKLYRQRDRAPLYNDGNYGGGNIVCNGPNTVGMANSDHFYISKNINGSDYIDLDNTSFYDFLQKFWTLVSVSAGVSLCGPGLRFIYETDPYKVLDPKNQQPKPVLDTWYVPNSTCAVPVAHPVMLFVQHSPILQRLRNTDPLFKARCCMGQNQSEDQDLCDAINHTTQSQTCDIYMSDFCTSHPDDPYCGCYDGNIQKEYNELPPELKTAKYEGILKATPRCWVKGCKTSYLQPNYRDMGNCQITICDLNQTVVGDNVIKNISGELMCNSGTPMQKNGTSTGSGTSMGSGTSNENNSPTITPTMWIIFIFVIFVLFVGIILMLKTVSLGQKVADLQAI